MERTVRTPDGRTLAVEDNGDPAGPVVLVHLGTPNSRHLYGPWVADAAGRGLRLIGYDRPGYGGSTPQPGRSIADCAGDVRAICAALEIDRVAMWGWSGGWSSRRRWHRAPWPTTGRRPATGSIRYSASIVSTGSRPSTWTPPMPPCSDVVFHPAPS